MKTFILAGILSLLTFFPSGKVNDLKDIAKPYLGEYECKKAQLGSVDCLERFSYIRLELKTEDTFVLHYQEKGEKKKQLEGKYVYDKKKGILKITDKGGVFKREFPLKDGVLTLSLPIGEKNLVLEFEQK